jgi:hypothetical protein
MNIEIKILRNEQSKPAGKLADAEIHFLEGDLAGLKLIGFGVWARRDGRGQNVTFPARQFTVVGERKNFSLLRAIGDPKAQDRIRRLVLEAYTAEIERVPQETHG